MGRTFGSEAKEDDSTYDCVGKAHALKRISGGRIPRFKHHKAICQRNSLGRQHHCEDVSRTKLAGAPR